MPIPTVASTKKHADLKCEYKYPSRQELPMSLGDFPSRFPSPTEQERFSGSINLDVERQFMRYRPDAYL
jgi:hypothetical protein